MQRVGSSLKEVSRRTAHLSLPGRGVSEQCRSRDNVKYDPFYFTEVLLEKRGFDLLKLRNLLRCYSGCSRGICHSYSRRERGHHDQ